ncbi:MAG: glycosyltransferase, partial [Candidatus Hydrogenedentes bacterium]|nr:glycosyltransferase [Candidatus Hydrogenedentota bacterium]
MIDASSDTQTKPVLPDIVPPAPADLWERKYEPARLQVLRVIALAALIGAPLTGSAVLATLSVLAFFVQMMTNAVRRALFLKNLGGLPCLHEGAVAPPTAGALPGVTFIAPARNEEAGIEAAARSVAALDYPNIEVIYVDDHSTDATPAILDRLAAEFPRLRVIHHPRHRDGWLGKANAVWHALGESDASNPWLVLADADVEFAPRTLRWAVAHAVANGLDFLTCVAYLDNGSLSEELFMPLAWAGLVQGAHFERLNEQRTPAIGVGAFILVKRAAYLACGGHAAICNRQPEDTLLAALIRRNGGNMGVFWTEGQIRVRIYRGYRQLRQFMARKMRMQTQDRLARMAWRVITILIQDVLPLPLFAAAVARQVVTGDFSLSMTVYAAAALLTYLTGVGMQEK